MNYNDTLDVYLFLQTCHQSCESISSNTFDIYSFLQTVGIIAAFILSLVAFFKSGKGVKINASQQIAQYHRELWLEYCRNEKLSRIFKKQTGVFELIVVTEQEKQFTNLVFIHMGESFSATKKRFTYKIDGLDDDIADFLSYPIPQKVWQEYSPYYDKSFVKYVNKIIAKRDLKK